MEDDILIELFSVVDVRLIEGVNDLKAFRSMCVIRKGYNGDLGLDRGLQQRKYFELCLMGIESDPMARLKGGVFKVVL
jgi:hypothetical protein